VGFIGKLVDEYVQDETEKKRLRASQVEGYLLGNYIIDQIPYADLEYIKFPTLPRNEDGDLDHLGETERVQKYGPLVRSWTGAPYVTDDDEEGQRIQYGRIPVGFPVEFGQKRYPEEGFGQWRFHNGLKAIRFEYRIFEGRPIERPAHIIVFYAGGDH